MTHRPPSDICYLAAAVSVAPERDRLRFFDGREAERGDAGHAHLRVVALRASSDQDAALSLGGLWCGPAEGARQYWPR